MLFSFNGSFRPYTYNCPQSFKYRAIDKVYPPRDEEESEEAAEPSARQQGIIKHKELADYLNEIVLGTWNPNSEPPFDLSEHAFIDEVVADIGRSPDVVAIEREFWVDPSYEPLVSARQAPDVLYARPDFFMVKHGKLWLIDWKFGNPEYGAPVYYKETEWFLAILSANFPEVDTFETTIHFPNAKYSLPRRRHERRDIANMQTYFRKFVDDIKSTRIFFPRPARHRCRLCDYRSEDTGGMGYCEDAAL